MNTPILEMKNITKEFPGVKALNNVSFQRRRGRDSLPGRRKWRREIDLDEGVERRLSARRLYRGYPFRRRRAEVSAASATAKKPALPLSTRNWRWSRK